MNHSLLKQLAAGIVLFGVCAANAASTVYTSATLWGAAVTGVTIDNYDTYGWYTSSGNDLSRNGSVTLSGINYSFTGGTIFGVSTNLRYDAAYLTTAYLGWQYSPNPFTITLPHAVTAVSFNYGEAYGNAGLTLSIQLGNGDLSSAVTVTNAYAFWGVVSDAPFNTLTLNADQNYPILDNFSYGVAVPEPGAAGLLAFGLLALCGCRPPARAGSHPQPPCQAEASHRAMT